MNRVQMRVVILNRFLHNPDDLGATARAIAETIDGPLGKNLLNLIRIQNQSGRQRQTIDSLMVVVDTWLDHHHKE